MTDEKNEFGVGEFGGQFGSIAASDVKTIIDDAMRQSGINPTNTAYRSTALSFLNQVYATALKGRHWKFMNRELSLELEAPYNVGKVSLVDGSHDVEEYITDGDPSLIKWNVNHLGAMFYPKGFEEGFYRIAEIVSLNKMIITPGFAGADTTIGTNYEIIRDRVVLDSKVQNVKSVRLVGYREMQPVGLEEFRQMKSINYTLTGVPRFYTLVNTTEQEGALTMEFYPAPDKRYAMHIEYNERILRLEDSETCYTVIPPEHNDVLVLGLRARLLEDQNNLPLSEIVNRDAKSAWNRMASDYEVSDGQPRIQPHRRNIRSRYNSRSKIFYGRKYFGRFD